MTFPTISIHAQPDQSLRSHFFGNGFETHLDSSQSAQRIHLSRLVGKPTMWFPNRSDTNRPVQAQKRARSLKFRI